MSTWRDMLTLFRKEAAHESEGSGHTLSEVVAEVNPAGAARDGEYETALLVSRRAQTDQLGDITQTLTSPAPQLAALQGQRVLAAEALRDIGRERRENQDHCFAQVLTFPGDQGNLVVGLFVVADGMGGHHDGAYASKLALSTVVQCVLTEFVAPVLRAERPAPQPVLQSAVQTANAAVYAAGHEVGSDMGTTCTAALLYGDDLIVAHVGDSRALLIGGGVKQLTTDHTAVGRLIAIGALTPDEAHDHPLRNQLYRSIGQQADVPVDVSTTTLGGATHVVLCSDGLWGLVPEALIADIVAEAPTPQIAARQLVAHANLLGGHDNISVVVVSLPARAESHV